MEKENVKQDVPMRKFNSLPVSFTPAAWQCVAANKTMSRLNKASIRYTVMLSAVRIRSLKSQTPTEA